MNFNCGATPFGCILEAMVKNDNNKNIRDAIFLSVPAILTLLLEKVDIINIGSWREVVALLLGVLVIIANRHFRESDEDLTAIDQHIF